MTPVRGDGMYICVYVFIRGVAGHSVGGLHWLKHVSDGWEPRGNGDH